MPHSTVYFHFEEIWHGNILESWANQHDHRPFLLATWVLETIEALEEEGWCLALANTEKEQGNMTIDPSQGNWLQPNLSDSTASK
jgi:hypothetical protein